MKIISLSASERDYLRQLLENAREYDQKVKVSVQGDRLIVKRGGGCWTPPIGQRVDGNGDPV